jgi:hypothetical protein
VAALNERFAVPQNHVVHHDDDSEEDDGAGDFPAKEEY